MKLAPTLLSAPLVSSCLSQLQASFSFFIFTSVYTDPEIAHYASSPLLTSRNVLPAFMALWESLLCPIQGGEFRGVNGLFCKEMPGSLKLFALQETMKSKGDTV